MVTTADCRSANEGSIPFTPAKQMKEVTQQSGTWCSGQHARLWPLQERFESSRSLCCDNLGVWCNGDHGGLSIRRWGFDSPRSYAEIALWSNGKDPPRGHPAFDSSSFGSNPGEAMPDNWEGSSVRTPIGFEHRHAG